MPTRTKEEWEAKQAADEVTKQAGNDERGKWQVELDDNVEKAKGMKGAKFKKERQGVYAIIGRLKALLNGQEVRNETGEKPPPRPAAAESSWDSWQPEGSTWNEGGTTTDNAIDNASKPVFVCEQIKRICMMHPQLRTLRTKSAP